MAESASNSKDEEAIPAKWEDAKRNGGKILVHKNFRYSINGRTDSKFFMACQERSNGCKSTATVDRANNVILSVRGEHNHDSDLVGHFVKEKVEEAVQNAVDNPNISPRTAYTSLTNLILQSPGIGRRGLGALPKMKTFARNIQRRRHVDLDCPAIPKNWSDHVLPEIFRKTSSGEDWVILDTHLDEEDYESPKILGFASETGVRELCGSTDWYGDGTFEICKPTMFSQLWMIVVKSSTGASIPAAFFLLPNKDHDTYVKALR